MLTRQQVKDVILSQGYIQDIGQIDDETKKALNRGVKKGQLVKSREPLWGIMAIKKTTYALA
jgi:ribosomal protein S8